MLSVPLSILDQHTLGKCPQTGNLKVNAEV